MASSLIFKAGALALACASTASAAYQYTLAPEDDYSGPAFFDSFIFNTTNDPNLGFVDYIDSNDALFDQLVSYDTASGTAYIGVDYWNTYSSTISDNNRGRKSIRAQTSKTYQYGLFVLDLAHMPAQSCGSWPTFWTSSLAHWPEQGQIDIIENVNLATYSELSLHTGPVVDGSLCEVVGNVNTLSDQVGQQTGLQETYNCIWNATTSDYGSGIQNSGQGCAANNQNPNNFGTAFNQNGGGVYVMEWTDEVIQIWSFGSGGTPVPTDLANGTPDPTTWGRPIFTTWGGNCDIAKHFIDHTVIFDIDFCGNWAGQQNLWEASTCYDQDTAATCNDYVAANPGSFSEVYWGVKSLKVYQYTYVAVSSSSTTTTTTSSTATSPPATTTSTTTTATTPVSTAVPTPVPTVGCYQEIGCWTEATKSRALTLATEVNYSIMTWEVCAEFCQLYGAVYFGVEYGGECYCGNEFEAGSSITSFSECNMPCDGNSKETCGSSDRLNVFKCAANLPPTSSSSSSSSSTTSSTSSSTTSSSTSSSKTSSSSASPSTSSSPTTTSTSSSKTTTSTSSSLTTTSSSTTSSSSKTSSSSASSSTSSSPTTTSTSTSSSTSKTSSSSASPSTSSSPTTTSTSSSKTTTSTSSSKTTTSTSSSPTTTSTSSSSTSKTSSSSTSPSTSSSPTTTSTSTMSSTSKTSSSSGLPSTSSSQISSSSGSSSSSSYLSSSILLSYSTSTSPYSNSSASSTPIVSYTTSIVSTTTTRTISSCAPTVTDCPYGQVVTDTIELYTTVCPVTETQISTPTTTASPALGETTTLTISTTIVYTITSCAPTVTNCPASLGQVTTETIELYTTVCPVSVAISLGLIPSPTGVVLPLSTVPLSPLVAGNSKTSTSTSTTTTSLTVVKLVTATVQPVASSFVSHTPVSNATVAGSTGIKGTSASTPSSSPIYKAGADELQAGSGMALVLVAVAALFL